MKQWLEKTAGILNTLFASEPVVLVDVGASGSPPEPWREIAAFSCYIGFDPDLRDLRDDNSFGFRRFLVLNKAIIDSSETSANFYLTASPHCSSFLKPNSINVDSYIFSSLFQIDSVITVATAALDRELANSGIHRVDWLKLDTQGKDLDIYKSLGRPLRNSLLAVDIEPGIIPFYEGENTFSPANEQLLQEGYWLSNLQAQRYLRISRSSQKRIAALHVNLENLPGSPTALEATYLRDLSQLDSRNGSLRDSVCLWMFCMLTGNYGAAIDVAFRIVDIPEETGNQLLHATVEEARRFTKPESRSFRSVAKSILPPFLYPLARKVFKSSV